MCFLMQHVQRCLTAEIYIDNLNTLSREIERDGQLSNTLELFKKRSDCINMVLEFCLNLELLAVTLCGFRLLEEVLN